MFQTGMGPHVGQGAIVETMTSIEQAWDRVYTMHQRAGVLPVRILPVGTDGLNKHCK